MEDWVYYSLSMTICIALSLLLSTIRPATGKLAAKPSLPPGPTALSLLLGPLLLLAWTSFSIEPIIRVARAWYGPVFTIYLLPTFPVIFVADGATARRVLVQCGAAFAERPPINLATSIFNGDQRSITTGAYGPLWRVLRRNLTGKALHPSSLRRYAAARRAAVSGLTAGIRQQMHNGVGGVVIQGLLHHTIFHVFARMCFGDGLSDGVVASITALQREFLSAVVGFQVLGVCPPLTKLVFRQRWVKMMSMRRQQEEVFIPLIRARQAQRDAAGDNFAVDCYVDSLLGLRIPEDGGGRNLTDEVVWRDPKRFRPERFLPGGEGVDVDLTGSKEMKMMLFGAGRRICPGIDVSLLHLEYFVANLVKDFEWREVPGEPVEFSERLELTMVMRRPLRAMVVPCC